MRFDKKTSLLLLAGYGSDHSDKQNGYSLKETSVGF
jgi:hypothetical protein